MKRLSVIASLLVCALSMGAQTFEPKYELINKAEYPTNDLAVATLNALDYGADPTGNNDCADLFQKMLDYLGGVGTASTTRGHYSNLTGGILYIPAGRYLCKKQLIVPRGVTIRGDWKKPQRGKSVDGTILMVQTASMTYDSEGLSFIVMQPTTEISNIAFWYPRQNQASGKYKGQIVKYPPTILYGASGYFGNDFCNVRHCTFINSYIAVKFSTTNGGGCPNVFDIYGTALHEGVVMDHIADVGRIDGVHFAPWYWEESGMPESPSAGQFDDYIYNNATGIIMRRIDWSYTANIDVEGYWRGFWYDHSLVAGDEDSKPNGQNYNLKLKNCQTGVHITAVSGAGVMFAKLNTEGCQTGVNLQPGAQGPAQFFASELQGREAAIAIDNKAGSPLLMQECKVNGPVRALGGQFVANANSFSQDVVIGPAARTVFTGNTFSAGASLRNNSLFKCEVSDAKPELRPMPEFRDEWMEIKTTKPARAALYVVTDAEFGAQPQPQSVDINTAPDCTQAIQKALDKAKSEGGGIVYLPAGHYHLDGHLIIPTGVELKGAGDIATVPKRNGAILEVYENEGNEDGVPFVTMEPNSGLRGVTFDYPSQDDPRTVRKFPYTIRGNRGVYLVNVGIRTAYKGVDLFTNKCDNHYVDYLAGHAFTNVIRVGGGSEGGIISNIQCNTNVYGTAYETKWGCWPNSTNLPKEQQSPLAGGQNAEDLDFMIIGDSRDQVIYNNFLFGCNIGMHFVDDGNGGAANVHSMGNAVDGAVKTVVVDGIATDLDLVNSQIVALNHDKSAEIIKGAEDAYFYKLGPNVKHTVTLFASDNWGGGKYFADVQGGQLNLYLANLSASGANCTFSTGGSGKVLLYGALVNNLNRLVKTSGTDERNIQIVSTVSNSTGASQSAFALWQNVLPLTWTLLDTSIYLPRTGWKAYAYNDQSGTGTARRAIDGNASTRWDTGSSQTSGQWFMVDMQQPTTFDAIILDTSGSSNDGPAGYTVEVYDADTDSWTVVEQGTDAGAVLVLTFPEVTASKVRINQTGSKGNYWSIHEFNLAHVTTTAVDLPMTAATDGGFTVYSLGGMRMATALPGADPRQMLSGMPAGIYVLRFDNGQTIKVRK